MAEAAAAASSGYTGTSKFVELLGAKLVKKMGKEASADETVLTDKALEGKKQIALYFSAHWCPPCRGFTPELAKTYNAIQKDKKAFEIVFVSSDRDRAACKEYHDEMPWLTLPYDDRTLKEKLSKLYKVGGIPSLIILDAQAGLVSAQGRTFVSNDPKGESFPWVPPTVKSALGDELLKGTKTVKVAEVLKGKRVALYFSAHWCPPCRGFTPKLVTLYKKMKAKVAAGTLDDFEFVFVSSDRDAAAFKEYYAEMPWLALPYTNRKGKSDLSSLFEIRGIPSLITLDCDGSVINKAARGSADEDPEGDNFPWFPKPVNDVNNVTDGLNDEICVVVLLDGAKAEDVTKRQENLKAVAEKYYAEAKAKKTDPKYRFFFEKAKGQVTTQIRTLCSVEGAQTILLNLGDEGSYYVATKEGDVAGLLADFEADKLEKKKVKQ